MGTITHCLHCPPLTAQPKKRNLFSLPIKPLPLLRASTHHPFPLTTHDSLRHYRKHLARSTAHSSFFPQTLPSIDDLSNISPLTVCKWSAIVSLALFAARKTVSTLLNPFFWTYFSWSWIFWPWLLAISLAIYGLYCFYKHSTGQSSLFEQLAIVTSTITWLTLVPPAHFNGFLQGWPIAIFFIYHYFFFFESTVRRRLYGDLYPRAHDPKWDVTLPLPFRIAFAVLVFVGHWLAAREGPELHLISGGWANFATWVFIAAVMFMRYHSILYLSKYSEKVSVPTAVVQFGPYRWVRHPIYASTMLLFTLHCITLRAPLSLLLIVAACLVYYGRKAELEEALMVDQFGDKYKEYMDKVRYKLIPLFY
ncbi:hypothetical protein J5N97_030275 [Dioscorea zingiberensis]|uniref:Protein-S-isoprenylcysteine O-methyltransferase n=1 Tax=Dioscorea zingiberensis TaxID=325984 RepID=A0A9D5H3Y9_9LILI|nr:hypothetical protein J5N97_030275 [Dioscorea zingiberensis]